MQLTTLIQWNELTTAIQDAFLPVCMLHSLQIEIQNKVIFCARHERSFHGFASRVMPQ